MANIVDVSIIIVNYNTYDLVLQCIDSVIKNTKNINFEIIVVDNKSPDRDIEMLNLIYPQVKLILNENNSGFGIANNIGNKAAVGEYIFLLNSDTIVIDNSIFELYKFISKNKHVGACGGNLCNIDLQPATSFTRVMPSFFADLDYLFLNVFTKLVYRKNVNYSFSETPFKINGNISGAGLIISKRVFDDLGGFDEDFFMYYEETDLLLRMRGENYQTFIVPRSKIIHLEGASESIKETKLNWTYASKKKYYLKNKSKVDLMLSDFLFYLTIIQRLLVFSLIGKRDKFNYWLDFYRWFKKR